MKISNGNVRKATLAALMAFLVTLVAAACEDNGPTEEAAGTSSAPGYLPTAGDRVVMSIHRFRPDDFETSKRSGIEAFGEAMQASGQTRRTYFLDDADSHVVVEVSFFHPDSSVDAWMNSTARQQAVDIVAPLYREAVDIQHLTVENVHDTPAEASYLPRPGDRVVIFTLRFTEEGYEEGKRVVPEGFGKAMEASGQTRRTYFTDDPESQTMMTFSFFHPDSATDEWLDHPERHKVLAVVEPLFREPMDIYHLEVEAVHDTLN